MLQHYFYLDVDSDSYVDMTSVRKNPVPYINSSKPEALQILNLIEGNASVPMIDIQKNVDSIDGRIVFLKLC